MTTEGLRKGAIATFLISMAILLVGGYFAKDQVPPIPAKVLSGQTAVTDRATIMRGQDTYQRYGLMDHGSVWGHGSLRGMDFAAHTLHMVGAHMRDFVAGAGQPQAGVTASSRRPRYASAVPSSTAAVVMRRRLSTTEPMRWPAAAKNYRKYLSRNSNDVEVLRKYAEACLSIRPLDAAAVSGAISAYTRIIELVPQDEVACQRLAMLYSGVGNFDELAALARARLERNPSDRQAPLWLGEALSRLNRMAEANWVLPDPLCPTIATFLIFAAS